MAEYEDILAMAKQLDNTSVAPHKKKGADITDEGEEQALNETDEDSNINWTFLREVPEYMKCNIICCNIFVEPQLLSCCGKNICKKCIECHIRRISVLTGQKPSCPYCREEEFQLIKNSALEASINLLKVQCLYQSSGCGWTGALKDGKLHLKECEFLPVHCPNRCGCEKFSCGKLSDHLVKCTHQQVSCSFQEVGCDAEMLRVEMNEHINDDIHQHLLLIAQSNLQTSSECKSTLATFRSNCEKSIQESIFPDMIASHEEKLTSLQSTIKKLEDELEEEGCGINSLSHSVGALAAMSAQLRQKQEQASTSEELYKAFIKEIQELPIPPAIGMSTPPVTFTIDNFKKRVATNDRWISQPFYTHSGGYKVCLCVFPNGHSRVRGAGFVSASIHFMTGEFDDHLTWPFPGGIFTVTAICQKGNKCNKSVHIEMNGENTIKMRVKQIDGSYGYGFGDSKFLAHDSELMRNFVDKDSLKVMVYHIQFLPL